MSQTTKLAWPLALSLSLVSPVVSAQTTTPAETSKPADTSTPAAKPDVVKKPSKAELGEMLKKCSEEADAKGLTIQKGKGPARNAYRRACMLKNGIAPRKK